MSSDRCIDCDDCGKCIKEGIGFTDIKSIEGTVHNSAFQIIIDNADVNPSDGFDSHSVY